MMTFTTFLSPIYLADFSSAKTASSMVLLSASAANCIWKRTIERNSELHTALYEIALVELWPGGITCTALLAKGMPQFFCNMWCKRTDKGNEVFQYNLAATL